MAKRPSNIKRKQKGPVDLFLKKGPVLLQQAIDQALSLPARLASKPALDAINNETSGIAASLGESLKLDAKIRNVEEFVSEVHARARNLSRYKNWSKDITVTAGNGGDLVFTIKNNSETGGYYVFFKSSETLPGSASLGAKASAKQYLEPMIKAMEAVGITGVDPSRPYQKIEFPVRDLTELDVETPDRSNDSFIRSVISLGVPKEEVGRFTSSEYDIKVGFELEIDASEVDIDVSIKPYAILTLSTDLISEIVDTEDKNSIPYLASTWVSNAVYYGILKSVKRWDNGKVTDLRIATKKLNKVVAAHGKIKPRVNKDGFSVGPTGIPIYIPEVNLSEQYMKTISSTKKDDKGFYDFETSLADWTNKIVAVDWFNDVLTFTDQFGTIKHIRMLGYIALDSNSEYVLLNSPISDKILTSTLKLVENTITRLITKDDAAKYLDKSVPVPETGLPAFSQLRFILSATTEKIGTTDPGHPHSNGYSIRLKHLVGLDLGEVQSDQDKRSSLYFAAYLKALASKRKDLDLDPLDRLQGLEYLLHLSGMSPEKYERLKDLAIKDRNSRKQQPAMKELAVPNLDAGGRLKGFMPQQVRALSNTQSNPYASLLAIDAGGGKTLMGICSIMLKKAKNPKLRSLVVTKPRLISQYISEVNYFSKGKINVVPLRIRNLVQLKNRYGIDTAKKFFEYVDSLPDNTIFICGYTDFTSRRKIFDDLEVPDRMLGLDVSLPQFLHLIRMMAFEITKCDESHLIKNKGSLRSEYTYSAISYSEQKILATGTFVPNTVLDMVGQGYSINPMAFGENIDAFKERFDLSSGIIKNDEQAARINERLGMFLQKTVAYKEDWAFVLPDLTDSILTIPLTNKQTVFYIQLLKEAEIEMKELLKGKKKLSDDEDDEDDFDDEEDEDESFMQKADASLAKIEQFVVAPDANSQYMSQADVPRGDDLVSPLVKLLDMELEANYGRGGDFSKSKAAVFGINKVASLHVMKHSRFVKNMVHYTSGNEEVIRKFKEEANQWILVADSTSLREGENLQLLSYIYDLQAPWRPGDFEQLVSRMYRPDPKGVFNKDEVIHKWLLAERADGKPGVNTVKLARMISKAISVARLRYSGDPRWEKTIGPKVEGLQLLKMNMDLIFNTEQSDVYPYIDQWKMFNDWTVNLNKISRKEMAYKIEQENPGVTLLDNNGNVIDRNLFTKLAMREAVKAKDLPGSKKAFTVWERNAIPPDVHDMGLKVVGTDKLEVGEQVMTEFGPGIVKTVMKSRCVVEVYGQKKFTAFRASITRPTNAKGKKKLDAILRDPSMWRAESAHASVILKNLADVKTADSLSLIKTKAGDKKIKSKDEDEDDLDIIEDEDDDLDAPEITEIFTYLLNGMPTLVVREDVPRLADMGWHEVEDFISIGFRSWALADKFIELLTKRYYVNPKNLKELNDDMDAIRDGKAMKLVTKVKPNEIRQFLLDDHRKLPKAKDTRHQAKPYVVSFDNEVKLAFSVSAHSPVVINWVKRMSTKNPGMKKFVLNESFYAKVFSNIPEAAKAIKQLGKVFNLPESELRRELRELKEDIKKLRTRRDKPVQ